MDLSDRGGGGPWIAARCTADLTCRRPIFGAFGSTHAVPAGIALAIR